MMVIDAEMWPIKVDYVRGLFTNKFVTFEGNMKVDIIISLSVV